MADTRAWLTKSLVSLLQVDPHQVVDHEMDGIHRVDQLLALIDRKVIERG